MTAQYPALSELKRFATGDGSLTVAHKHAMDDPSIVGDKILAFFTTYQSNGWTVGEARVRAGELARELQADVEPRAS